jgi:protein-S-isoprenylcysteine O-methyltransferase Ste14
MSKFTLFKRGGLWVVGQTILLVGVIGAALVWHSSQRNFSVSGLGVVLLVVSGVMAIAGARALGKNLTPFPKPCPEASLVRSGIYRLIRHPLYTSVWLAAMGWALVWQSWPAGVVVFILILFLDAKARREERWLCEKFPEYADYAKTSWRFIPWVY